MYLCTANDVISSIMYAFRCWVCAIFSTNTDPFCQFLYSWVLLLDAKTSKLFQRGQYCSGQTKLLGQIGLAQCKFAEMHRLLTNKHIITAPHCIFRCFCQITDMIMHLLYGTCPETSWASRIWHIWNKDCEPSFCFLQWISESTAGRCYDKSTSRTGWNKNSLSTFLSDNWLN